MSDEVRVLLDQISPFGNINAIVEEGESTVYFYLFGPEGVIPLGESAESWSPIRQCWVCNKIPVGDNLSDVVGAMHMGMAPILPAESCAHASTPIQLDPKQLEVIWFEEGDCAALLHAGEIMAVIPAWASPGISQVTGYAKECRAPFMGLLPLADAMTNFKPRIEAAAEFWHTWTHPRAWDQFQQSYLKILTEQFGQHSRYFAIDGGHFPPKAVVIWENDHTVIFVTIGVSILAQPRVELYSDEPQLYRRFEFGMAIDRQVVDAIGIEAITAMISQLVCIPWQSLTWLGHQHTLETALTPFDHLVLITEGLSIPAIKLPEYRGGPVNLLWGVPLDR